MDEITQLYDGKIELKFSPERHLYTVKHAGADSVTPVPGVTTILGIVSKPLVKLGRQSRRGRLTGQF